MKHQKRVRESELVTSIEKKKIHIPELEIVWKLLPTRLINSIG